MMTPFSFEEIDAKNEGNFFHTLSSFFRSEEFPFEKRVVFAPGTAPMNRSGEDLYEILYATNFDEAIFVDPGYSEQWRLQQDFDAIRKYADGEVSFERNELYLGESITVAFYCAGKQRKLTFVAGDATKQIPEEYNIFFSGRRVAINHEGKEYGITERPNDRIKDIVARLPIGGLFFPDRDFDDDAMYFDRNPEEYGLEEVEGIRQPGMSEMVDFDKVGQLTERYTEEAIADGILRRDSEIPTNTYLEEFGGIDSKPERYETVDDFFDTNPDLNRDECEDMDDGVFIKKGEGFSKVLGRYEERHYTEDEEKVIRDIGHRARKNSSSEVEVRGCSLYRRVS
jgi:hypothetical protein